MPDNTLAFVFDSAEAAQAAAERLHGAGVALKSLEIDRDVVRYGVPSAYPGAQWVLVLDLELAHDDAYVTELVRGSGRLVPVPAPESEYLNLEVEHLRTQNLWRSMADQNVPMCAAAAMAFHTAHADTKAMVGRRDYEDALGIAASALSRLARIYTIGAITQKRIEVQVNLLTHRFVLGATQLRARDGSGVIEPLFVQRGDLQFALSAIKRAGLAFSFALLSPATHAKALEHSGRAERKPA